MVITYTWVKGYTLIHHFVGPCVSSTWSTILIVICFCWEFIAWVTANSTLLRVFLSMPMAHQPTIVWGICLGQVLALLLNF